jgi:hypothetical protein
MEEFQKPFDKEQNLGQKGCTFSHLKLYKYIIENQIQVCTIFEDDVHFHPQWKDLAPKYFQNTPNNFDIIFMGNQVEHPDKIPRINTKPCYCLHAYIITLEGAKKLLSYLLNWDYWSPDISKYMGHTRPITGLVITDVMIKNIQQRMNNGTLSKKIYWYCWNGTYNECEFNKLPLKGINVRNTGLVFQSNHFYSLLRQDYDVVVQ